MFSIRINTTFQGTRIFVHGYPDFPGGMGWVDPAGGGDFFFGSFNPPFNGTVIKMVGVWGVDSMHGVPAKAELTINERKQVTGVAVWVRDPSGEYVPVQLAQAVLTSISAGE